MNVVQRNFLRLLSAGTFGTDAPIEPMSPFKWRQLFCLASLHDVATLVYDGISKMNGQFHIQLPADLYAQWQKTVADVERDNNRKNEIIASVFTAMSDIRTCPVLINGHSLAQFYPNPGHRAERSIDYYISDEKQAQHAAEWMDDHSVSQDDTDSNVTRYVFDGMEVNHYWTMRHLTNPMLNHKLQNIINKEMRCRDSFYITVNGVKMESVPPTLSLLMLITGIIQHILSDGISLKLFVDLGMFLRNIGDKVDYVQLQSQLRKLGMQTMANIIGRIMIEIFRFDADELPFMTMTGINADRNLVNDVFAMNNKKTDWYFTQGEHIFIRTTNSSAMMWQIRHSAKLMRYYPSETFTNFFVSFARSLSHIEE